MIPPGLSGRSCPVAPLVLVAPVAQQPLVNQLARVHMYRTLPVLLFQPSSSCHVLPLARCQRLLLLHLLVLEIPLVLVDLQDLKGRQDQGNHQQNYTV